MATRGRPPVPNEVKRKRGNPGRRPLPNEDKVARLEPAAGPPPIPKGRPLGEGGLDMWNRIWTGGRMWLSPITDFDLALMVCEYLDERIALRVRVMTDERRLDRVALRAVDREITAGLSELGFTPLGRTRLGVAEVGEEIHDDLERIRRRREERLNGGS